jgi:uncharacterized protein YciI
VLSRLMVRIFSNRSISFQHSPFNSQPELKVSSARQLLALTLESLFDRGLVVLGGPFADHTGSMVIVRAQDASEARAMFRHDPWNVQDILVVADVKEWTIFLDDSDRRQAH